ncbi:MAG: hypothetical protein ACUVS7_12965, partial [Bryobacteraceae bacterium]
DEANPAPSLAAVAAGAPQNPVVLLYSRNRLRQGGITLLTYGTASSNSGGLLQTRNSNSEKPLQRTFFNLVGGNGSRALVR